jgi:hypothetical protein
LRDLAATKRSTAAAAFRRKSQSARRQEKQEKERGVIPMTDLVLNAAPLFAVVRPRLEALGLLLSQAIDAFAEARMRSALPARLFQAELERDRVNSKESLTCSY